MDNLTDPAALTGRAAPPRRRRLLLLAALLALLAASALLLRPRSHPTATAAAGAHRKHGAAFVPPQPVSVATVAPATIRVLLNGLGTVTPLATVNIVSQISGQIMQIGFTEGQAVRKGDFLIQIDPRPYQVSLETAEASLAKDEALLGEARTDLARYQGLARLNSIAVQQAQDQAFVVKQDEAAVAADHAAIDSANLNLTYCHITSPIDGRVGLRQVDLGNYVQSSSATPLVVVTQLQPISVEFSLPEDDVPAIETAMKQQALPVLAYDRSNTRLLATGSLAALDTEVNNTTGTVAMRAMFDNQDNALYPQQFLNVQLVVKTLANVLTLPTAAIQHGAPGTYVYRVDAADTVHVVTIGTGATDGARTQITSGLSAGDTVVTDGVDRLKDGAKVSIPAAAAPK